MEEDYEKFLKSKKVVELKNIARSYIKHIKFAFTGVKKDELIKHLLKHTMLEDGQIKVVDSVVPVKVLIKGRSEDNVKKLIDESDFEIRDREKIRNLLLGQRGQFSGRISRLQTEIDEFVKDDKDNLKKIHTEHIKERMKVIEETKKQLKVVNALIIDFNKKLDEKIQEKKAMKKEPKKEVMKVEPKKEVMKVEPKKEVMKVEPKKEIPKDKLTFFEYMEPTENKTNDDLIPENKKIILDKIADELDNVIDVDKYNEIIYDIPNLDDILNKIIMWIDKKKGKKDEIDIEYLTFIKSVIYNLFLKTVLDKLKVNTFGGIIISNIIASDPILRQYYDNNTKYTITKTFIEAKPFIPKSELSANLKKLTTDYFMSGQKK
jgi:hypothetical protein